MELVRYRPGEAIRWLQTGADNLRKVAGQRGKSVVGQTGVDQRGLTENMKTAATALFQFGRGTYADVVHKQAEASEYVLQSDRFDIVRGNSIKTILYSQVKGLAYNGERAILSLDKGKIVIKPFAHIVAGRIRVPLGWVRNGMEVPFELLIEELSARTKLEIEEE